MSIEALINHINSESDDEAQKILRNAYSEVARIRNDFGQKLKAKEDMERKRYETRVKELRNVHLAQAHREERRLLLEAEESLIEKCFSGLAERLAGLRGEAYEKSIRNKMIEGLKLLGGEATVRLVREDDRELVKKIIDELSQSELELEYEGTHKKVRPKITIENELLPDWKLGGIYLSSTDGRKLVDNTFATIIERNREIYRIEISGILFNNK